MAKYSGNKLEPGKFHLSQSLEFLCAAAADLCGSDLFKFACALVHGRLLQVEQNRHR